MNKIKMITEDATLKHGTCGKHVQKCVLKALKLTRFRALQN